MSDALESKKKLQCAKERPSSAGLPAWNTARKASQRWPTSCPSTSRVVLVPRKVVLGSAG